MIILADATRSQVKPLRQTGADVFLAKPLDVKRFLEVVEATLARGVLGSAARCPVPRPSA